MLQDIGVANRIVDNRRNLMKAFETGLKTVNISTEDLTAISSHISGASIATYLLMHPKIQSDDFVRRLSSVPYHESDFYRASFLDWHCIEVTYIVTMPTAKRLGTLSKKLEESLHHVRRDIVGIQKVNRLTLHYYVHVTCRYL